MKNEELDKTDTINDTKIESAKKECQDIGEKRKLYLKEYRIKHKERYAWLNKELRRKNKTKYKLRDKLWYKKNSEKSKKRCREWRKLNSNKCKIRGKLYRESHKNYFKDYLKRYRKLNPEYHNSYNTSRRIKDINFKLTCNLRSRLSNVIRGKVKGGSTVKDLGCSIEEFKEHIESKFLSGMSWKNWGKFTWHIDHIIPLSKFDLTDRKQFLVACNYKNLQPLWAKDNLKKGCSI